MTKYMLVALAGAAITSTAAAQAILPPDFNLAGGASTPVHQQALGGMFNVTGFWIRVDALAAGTNAWQSDIAMTLTSPNGTVLNLGPNFLPPSGHVRWLDLPHVGTPPQNSDSAQLIDAVYDFNFGPVNGNWTVSFEHTYSAGGDIHWTSIYIEPIPTPGSLALLGLGGLVAARRRR